jgi:hypothetical protein
MRPLNNVVLLAGLIVFWGIVLRDPLRARRHPDRAAAGEPHMTVINTFYTLLQVIVMLMVFRLQDKVRHLDARVRDLDHRLRQANDKLEQLDFARRLSRMPR